ncbi:hypothetical protein [Cardinium endosymbiont of Tipula unca]|uniref:D-alanine--D-alanine ligase family protein n=1 Tax=Cardinium endosymbiont of Tipula unca TaxID=3066216 RepID=UPI0030D335E0
MGKSATTPIKVGVFFGGKSREREISFAGGRTVYDHLDRRLFEPVPIFVDSLGHFILLNWPYLYQGTIREFYPAVATSPSDLGIPLYIESIDTSNPRAIEKYIAPIGKKLEAADFCSHFEMAFLCLHGSYGEDGTIQGLLEWYQIPYSGSGILPAALGMNKVFQKRLLKDAGFLVTPFLILSQKQWLGTNNKAKVLHNIIAIVGFPFVVKSSMQGSSIGVTIVTTPKMDDFTTAINRGFFMEEMDYHTWDQYTLIDKKDWLNKLTDVREGIGFPLLIEGVVFYTPSTLLAYIEGHFVTKKTTILLISTEAEEEIVIESFIQGREFSCIVLEEAKDKPIALPPTEMLKENVPFDYRAKYLPGIVRKQTPMCLPAALLDAIQKDVLALFKLLNCKVYARIDGFITDHEEIILNDPNTTAGMNPSSFLFHQAAEIGLNPTQLLTFIIKRSLEVRKETYKGYLAASSLLEKLENIL